MKILLIRPAPKENIFGAESFLPLGIAYIASSLEKAGHEVKVFDLTVNNLSDDEVIGFINNNKIELVGFTAVTPIVQSAYRLAGIIKEKTSAKTFAGGPHPTALPDEPLKNNIDIVVRGEGENTAVELCNNMNKLAGIKGISFRNGNNNVHNPNREYIKDLDALPFPARHLFPPLGLYKGQPALGNRLPVGSILTSRGCPFECTFCFKAVFGRHFRARSVENILSEWKLLVKDHKVREMAIIDDSFTTDPKRVIELCDRIIKEKLKVPWGCPNGIRVDTVPLDLMKKMREAGCYRVAFGVESGSQRILDSIGKKVKLAQIEEAFRTAKKAKIETTAFFMIGNIEEDESTIQETIDFAKKISPTYVQFLIAIPFPGSKLYEEVKKNGDFYVNQWDEYGEYDGKLCFQYKNINRDLISRMYTKAYRDYYLRPGYIMKQLVNPHSYRHFGRRIKAFFRFLK